MTRVLIVADYAFTFPLAEGELSTVSAPDDEVFLLLCDARPSVLRRLRMRSGGFWTRTNATLDLAVVGLSTLGVATDGLASDASPREAVRDVATSFGPDEVLVSVSGARGARLRSDLGELVASLVPERAAHAG